MSRSNFFFYYQQGSKEDKWQLALAGDRQKVVDGKPAFTTVLDLSGEPSDKDWSKVRYRGPFYADFDVDRQEDLGVVCDSLRDFLGRLDGDLDFDVTQARLFASGGKGFHVEIPQECFIQKIPDNGIPWLAYVYRVMAEKLVVDNLDLNVYTGKRGRQWRTPNVLRDNGNYKVPISVEEALTMTPELYRELISAPRVAEAITPPTVNPKFVILFEQAREKVTASMRHKAKRVAKANGVLGPWKQAGKVPPTIAMLMRGESVRKGVGFQSLAMQLAIYAASVEMKLDEFLMRCEGLIKNHVGDGYRYSSPDRRKDELSRMWEYMMENTLYDFEVDPLSRMVEQGVDASDLGILAQEDTGDRKVPEPTKSAGPDDGDDEDSSGGSPSDDSLKLDVHKGLRRGFFMNAEGMFRRDGDGVVPLCRATLRNVDAMQSAEDKKFIGYEFDIVVSGRNKGRVIASSDTFTSAAKLRQFFAAYQISYQGGDYDAASLMDVIAEKAERNGPSWSYPREGLFIIDHPMIEKPTQVVVYLTKDSFISSLKADDPHYFALKYRAIQATSSYGIDIHWAPDLDQSMGDAIEDIFRFNAKDVVANLLGWFIAAHYRSFYLKLFRQFPLLQYYGIAGSGKSQTMALLGQLHWYHPDRVKVRSAMAFSKFALHSIVSTSTSAPLIIDEYKPREMKIGGRGSYEILKDVLKMSYTGSEVGERGTLTKGAETSLGVVTTKATAPIAFGGEAIEAETALVERSVVVALSPNTYKNDPSTTRAFNRLCDDPTALSAIGKAVVQLGFTIDLDAMRKEVRRFVDEEQARFNASSSEMVRRSPPRVVFNHAVVHHALSTLKFVLHQVFGDRFDARVDELVQAKIDQQHSEENSAAASTHVMSEISKVLYRLSHLSQEPDLPYGLVQGKDYAMLDGVVELNIVRCYDKYRLYCGAVRDTPLYDTLEAFIHALHNYTATVDRRCVISVLRKADPAAKLVRLSLPIMISEGVPPMQM